MYEIVDRENGFTVLENISTWDNAVKLVKELYRQDKMGDNYVHNAYKIIKQKGGEEE